MNKFLSDDTLDKFLSDDTLDKFLSINDTCLSFLVMIHE